MDSIEIPPTGSGWRPPPVRPAAAAVPGAAMRDDQARRDVALKTGGRYATAPHVTGPDRLGVLEGAGHSPDERPEQWTGMLREHLASAG